MRIQWDFAGFNQQTAAFSLKTGAKMIGVFDKSKEHVATSVKDGSSTTAAPGQAVDTGFLYSTWKGRDDGFRQWLFSTNARYARVVEEGMTGASDRSPYIDPQGVDRPTPGTGNPSKPAAAHAHSVKLTRGGWKNIVDGAVAEVKGGA